MGLVPSIVNILFVVISTCTFCGVVNDNDGTLPIVPPASVVFALLISCPCSSTPSKYHVFVTDCCHGGPIIREE